MTRTFALRFPDEEGEQILQEAERAGLPPATMLKALVHNWYHLGKRGKPLASARAEKEELT